MRVTAVNDLFLCPVYHLRNDADATVSFFLSYGSSLHSPGHSDNHTKPAGRAFYPSDAEHGAQNISAENQRFQLFQIDTRQRIDIIVDIRLDWTCRIEKFRNLSHTSPFTFDNLYKSKKNHSLYSGNGTLLSI